MTKRIGGPGGVLMISGKLYVAFQRSQPHGDRHRLLVHERSNPAACYWAESIPGRDKGPWKIVRPATLEEVEATIEAEVERIDRLSDGELRVEIEADGSTVEECAARATRAIDRAMERHRKSGQHPSSS